MSRNETGTYSLPSGNPVISGETIQSSWANTTLDDIANSLTSSLDRSGRGGMLAPFTLTDGTEAEPGLAWGSEPNSGFYRAALGDIRVSILGTDSFRWTNSSVEVWSGGIWNQVLFANGGGTIPPGTTNYQTVSWDNDTGDWNVSSTLLSNYTTGDVSVLRDLAVGRDISLTGTVDGRNVSSDGTTLDNHVLGVTGSGVDIHYSDAPNDGNQYARKDLGWTIVAASGAVVPDGIVEGQTLRWDQTGGEWVYTSGLISASTGNVGINDTSPEAPLTVKGEALIRNVSIDTDGVGLNGLGDTTTGIFRSGTETIVRNTGSVKLDDGTDVTRLVGGILGVGTETPNLSSKIDINGDIYTKGLPLIDAGVTTAQRFAVVAVHPGVGADADVIYFVTV
jgi:hypothetical protein